VQKGRKSYQVCYRCVQLPAYPMNGKRSGVTKRTCSRK